MCFLIINDLPILTKNIRDSCCLWYITPCAVLPTQKKLSVLLFWQDWYYLSKTVAEREAFAYAAKTGLDIVTICPSLVIGPLMQSTVNASSKVLINYFKGNRVTSLY